MAVCIGLYDGEQFGIGSREPGEKTVIVFKGAGSDFNPTGAR
jgi:hypothetical protein